MILGVNGIRLVGRRTGVGRAVEAILKNMGRLPHPFEEIRVYTHAPVDPGVALPPGARNVVLPSRLPLGLWEQTVLPYADRASDLLLCPSYVATVASRPPTFLIHHGSYEAYPEAFSRYVRTKARLTYAVSAHRATAMSTVSEQSKRNIVRYYRVPAEKVHVVPEGVDTTLFRPTEDEEQLARWRREVLGADVPFLMYVGKPTRRRNLPALIEAFGRLKRADGIPHVLLLVGTELHGAPFREAVDRLGLHDAVRTVGFASHEDLAIAYNAADLFVYPSSYEGFGMPVLEAIACGTPTIALDNSAFPEFAGGVATLLPDAHVETLRAGIAEILADGTVRDRTREAGPRRAARYDWHVVTERYIELMAATARGG